MTYKCLEHASSPPQHTHNYGILQLKFLVEKRTSIGAIGTYTPDLPSADIFLFPELNV